MASIQSAPYTKYSIAHVLPSNLTELEADVTAAYQHWQTNAGGTAVAEDTFELTIEADSLVISWIIPDANANAVATAPPADPNAAPAAA